MTRAIHGARPAGHHSLRSRCSLRHPASRSEPDRRFGNPVRVCPVFSKKKKGPDWGPFSFWWGGGPHIAKNLLIYSSVARSSSRFVTGKSTVMGAENRDILTVCTKLNRPTFPRLSQTCETEVRQFLWNKMMASRSKTTEPRTAQLTIEGMRAALPKLERRIKELEAFDVASIQSRSDDNAAALVRKINGTLQDILGHGTVEYNEYDVYDLDTLPIIMGHGPWSVAEIQQGYRDGIASARSKLISLKELFEERIADAASQGNWKYAPALPVAARAVTRRVFIVHGHNDGIKETVARYVEALDLEPIILHEKPNEGRTIVEKFEVHSGQAGFAIVLCTGDDIGYSTEKGPDQSRPRPRQNVILELGFFMAALGRQRVCALVDGNIEMPSDYAGVLYTQFDAAGAWRLIVAREIRSAGIEVDLNKAI